MATVERVGKLMNPGPHTRVVTTALRQPLPGKCTMLHHLHSTINPPKQEWVLRLAAARTWVNCLCALYRASVRWSAHCAMRRPPAEPARGLLVP